MRAIRARAAASLRPRSPNSLVSAMPDSSGRPDTPKRNGTSGTERPREGLAIDPCGATFLLTGVSIFDIQEDLVAKFQAMALNWGPTIVFNVVLPYVTYSMLTDRGMSVVAALAISGLWPAVELLGIYLI